MNTNILSRVLAALCILLSAAPAAAQPQSPPATQAPPAAQALPAVAGGESYVLGVGDTIEVSILGRTDFNARARVANDGSVLLPYIGAVPAINRSAQQLAQEVRAALEGGGFFSRPEVRVEVVSVTSRYVTVLGNVSVPGLLPLERDYRLSEIMARVGGRAAGGADQVILTRASGTSQRYKIADLATGAGESDPIVNPGDKIYVPSAENEVFYLTGAVKSPGAYPITPDLTVRIALAKGGGVSDMGSEKRVKINRKGQDLKKVDLDATKVEPGDILKVGERLF